MFWQDNCVVLNSCITDICFIDIFLPWNTRQALFWHNWDKFFTTLLPWSTRSYGTPAHPQASGEPGVSLGGPRVVTVRHKTLWALLSETKKHWEPSQHVRKISGLTRWSQLLLQQQKLSVLIILIIFLWYPLSIWLVIWLLRNELWKNPQIGIWWLSSEIQSN